MPNPFTLPDGNVQIAFSGGRTSGMMLHHILEANGGLPDRAKVIFTNVGREFPETLDFVQECAERWGIHIIWAEYCRGDDGGHSYQIVSHNSASRDGEPLKALMRYFGFPPNRAARFCSHEGKTRTARRVCVDHLGWGRWATSIGIRADEAHRCITGTLNERYSVWYPMARAGLSKRDVRAFWKRQPFDLRLENVDGKTPRGNCDGCFLKSEANRAALARDHRERAEWWNRQEKRYGATFHRSTSWQGLIDLAHNQRDWIFDTEGALCQASDGECVETADPCPTG